MTHGRSHRTDRGMTTQKVGVVSCGTGTQHLAMPKDLNTLCGKRIEYDLLKGKFDPELDCQQCKKSAEEQLLIATNGSGE